MIVAGLGFRRGVSAEEIEAAVALALGKLGLSAGSVDLEEAPTLKPASSGRPLGLQALHEAAAKPPNPLLVARRKPSLRRHPRESGDPVNASVSVALEPDQSHSVVTHGKAAAYWVPAFAGMTAEGVTSALPLPRYAGFAMTTDAATDVYLAALATLAEKADEPGLVEAARRLSLPIIACSREAMAAVQDRIVTFSARAEAAVGLPSVAEAAALAASGGASRLLVPRVATAAVTCAIAEGEGP